MKSLSLILLGILLTVSAHSAQLNGGYQKPLSRKFSTLKNLRQSRQKNETKIKAFYEQYPQLTSDQTNPCVKGFSKMLFDLLEYPYNMMTMYGTFMINDLGSYQGCKTMADIADYAVMSLNISHSPIKLNLGACLPKECKQADYSYVSDNVSGMIANFLKQVLNGTGGQPGIIQPWTTLSVTFRKPDEIKQAWRDGSKSGFIAFLAIAAPLLALISLLPCIYHVAKKIKYNNSNSEINVFSADSPALLDQSTSMMNQDAIQNSLMNSHGGPQPVNNINQTQFSSNLGFGLSNDPTRDQSKRLASQEVNRITRAARYRMNESSEISMAHESVRPGFGDNNSPIDNQEGQQQEKILENKAESKMSKMQALISSFSWISAFNEMKQTKCYAWDNRELDVLEAFKFISFALIQVTATSLFITSAATNNTWKMLDFFKQVFFTVVGSANQGIDVFFAISGFLGVYKCLQIYDANGGFLTVKDSLKLYARKFLRLAPMTYFIFFLTWASISRISDGPMWMNTQSLFYKCDQYWWAQILFIGNLVPYFTEVTVGCFYWGWAIYCDFQCFLFVPLFAVMYKRWPNAAITTMILLIFENCLFIYLMSNSYGFKAGPLAIEDYYMFSYVFNKPYTKQCCQCVGVLLAYCYYEILKYRKLTTDEERQKQFPKLHWFYLRPNLGIFLNWLSVALIVFSLCSGFQANEDPYQWDQWLNNLYWGINRLLFVLGAMTILFTMFIGQFNSGLRTLKNTYFRAFGKLTFLTAIISPVILNIMYCGREDAIYLTNPTVMNIGAGNIICVALAAFPLYLLVEYPIQRLTQVLITDRLGHHELLKQHYLNQIAIAEAPKQERELLQINPKKLEGLY